MLDLANPLMVLKIFCVRDECNREHHGLVYATNELSDWKGTGAPCELFLPVVSGGTLCA